MDPVQVAKLVSEALMKKGTKQASGVVLILDEHTIQQIVTDVIKGVQYNPSL